jgi:hypothetical protein
VKTTKNVFLAMLALTLLSTPALAQTTRSNKGGQDKGNVGDERAAQVHMLNQSKKKKKKDKDHDPAASTSKTKGFHRAMGHLGHH